MKINLNMSCLKALFLIGVFANCSTVNEIGTRPHSFGERALKIIWIQVAGLDSGHISLARLDSSVSRRVEQLENPTCFGQAWSSDLSGVVSGVQRDLLTQVVGKPTLTGTCDDAKQKPIWFFLKSLKRFYNVVVEEGGDQKESLYSSLECDQGGSFLGNSVFIKRGGVSKSWYRKRGNQVTPVLLNSSKEMQTGIYRDQTCLEKKCLNPFADSFNTFVQQNLIKQQKLFFLYREFNYLRAIEKGNFKAALEVLDRVQKMIQIAKDAFPQNETLILVTGGGSRAIDIPAMGKKWRNFDQTGRISKTYKRTLSVPVYAYGASSENFCGIYSQSDIFRRIFYREKTNILKALDL